MWVCSPWLRRSAQLITSVLWCVATQTIGVVGTGNIGLAAIRIFKGFGTRVIAHDPYGKPELAEELGFEYVSLDELLESSDIISLHCPLVRHSPPPHTLSLALRPHAAVGRATR